MQKFTFYAQPPCMIFQYVCIFVGVVMGHNPDKQHLSTQLFRALIVKGVALFSTILTQLHNTYDNMTLPNMYPQEEILSTSALSGVSLLCMKFSQGQYIINVISLRQQQHVHPLKIGCIIMKPIKIYRLKILCNYISIFE